MYKLKSYLLGRNHRLRPGRVYEKTTITIHSTGNPNSTAENERAWLDNPANDREAAWHYVCGEGVVITALPEDEECWHCGKTEGNRHSIAIEIVESGNRTKVLMTAAEFTADLLRRKGWGTERFRQHHDWTGKNCPRILIDKRYIKNGLNWDWFVKTVEEYLKKGGEDVTKPTKQKLIVDGKEVKAECVNIDGYNFYKLRDLCPLMGYNVGNNGKVPVIWKNE